MQSIAGRVQLHVEMHPEVLASREISRITGIGNDGMIEEGRLNAVLSALYNRLAENGFPLAELDSVVIDRDTGGKEVTLYMDPGPELTFWNENEKPLRLDAAFLEATATAILDSLTNSGFPFARVSFVANGVDSHDGILTTKPGTRITRGSFVRIGKVTFTDVPAISEKFFRLESRLHSGDPFSRDELNKALGRLNRLQEVSDVGEPALKLLSPGIVEVIVPVVTHSSTRINGIAAIAQGSNRPTGEFTIDVGNLFRGGRSFSFGWYGLNPDRQGLKSRYHEGWILDKPVAIEGELEGWQIRDAYNRTIYRLGLYWEPLSELRLGVTGSNERIAATNDTGGTLSSRTEWLGASVTLDRLDSQWNPSRGYLLSLENSTGWRKPTGESAVGQVTTSRTRLEYVLPLLRAGNGLLSGSGRWIGFLALENRQITGRNLVSDEMPQFGGSNVRGYLEDSFTGRNVVFGSIECRYRPGPSAGYLGVCSDWGWVSEQDAIFSSQKREAFSVGLTSSFRSALGIIGLAVAWPSGEPVDQIRLHVKLTSWL